MSQTSSATTDQADRVRGRAVVVQPENGPSYWQPVPANGHADPKLYPACTGFTGHAMGSRPSLPATACGSTRTVTRSSCRSAFAATDVSWSTASSHPLVPGTSCFLGFDVKHELINESPNRTS